MQPLVGIIMGSRSDWDTMRAAVEILEKLGVPHEVQVVSAHRTPDLMFEYASTAASRGIEVIIAGAGGAAHLPGMTAAKTRLPVLGVPVQSKTLTDSIPCCRSCRCRREFLSPRSRSARPAPPMRA
jgi:5-(carboxyamino)imidazole ribonucleotide mutase